MEHAGIHNTSKWFLCNGFLCLQYHYISNQKCMQVQTKPCFTAVKETRGKRLISHKFGICLHLDHTSNDMWMWMKHNWLESNKQATREKKEKYLSCIF